MNSETSLVPSIAVIEDDEDLRANLLLSLRGRGATAWGVASAEEFYRESMVKTADIVLVDLGLPGEDGLSAIRHLRQSGRFGIIVVTARGGTDHRIAGLEAGADHYFVKPVDQRELLAAIDGLWRRLQQARKGAIPDSDPPDAVWILRMADASLTLPDGRKLTLSERECCLVRCLLAAQGVVVSKAALHDAVFPEAGEVDLHRIDVILSRLRQKLESQFGVALPVRTIFGRGFTLAAESRCLE